MGDAGGTGDLLPGQTREPPDWTVRPPSNQGAPGFDPGANPLSGGINPRKMASGKRSSKGQAWFCTTNLPSDVIIEVDGTTFHLHKFPLMSKSRKLHKLITEQEMNPKIRSTGIQNASVKKQKDIQEEEDDDYHITLPEFPGGSESFQTAAKFCYGLKIDLSASNAAPLRCAGEYLEMKEEYSEDNLISKTERFLSQFVFKNIKNSIITLKTCEKLMPLAVNLSIVERCIDAISSRAASSDPSLFGWPVNGRIEENLKSRSTNGKDSWFDELGLLSLPFFKQLIFVMKSSNLSSEIIDSCLISYAKKYIPGISRTNWKPSASPSNAVSKDEQREILEIIISNFSLQKSPISSSATTRFLFRLLRTVNILKASEACRAALEKKIGWQLEGATLDDLLVPSFSYSNETLYDVDCVQRILGHFLQGLEERSLNRIEVEDENSNFRSAALMLVGKLIDGYLSEIASDVNLQPENFYQLAVSLPEYARLFHDGLYRAVDVYLKAHPLTMEAEREKICGILDCRKLTLEACTHAAQNERLPLKAVVQVLFFEQLQLRQAIAGTHLAAEAGPMGGGEDDDELIAVDHEQEGGRPWRAVVRENQVLKQYLDSMRTRVHQLERECSTTRKAIGKMGPPATVERGGRRTSLKKVFGCKFYSQVCYSHEPAAAEEGRKGRSHRRDQ